MLDVPLRTRRTGELACGGVKRNAGPRGWWVDLRRSCLILLLSYVTVGQCKGREEKLTCAKNEVGQAEMEERSKTKTHPLKSTKDAAPTLGS